MATAPTPVSDSVNGWNAAYLEAEYERYQQDPSAVSPDMAQFFRGFDLAMASIGEQPTAGALASASAHAVGSPGATAGDGARQAAVDHLINAYRRLGHLCAQLDPFDRERKVPQALMPQYYGFTDADLAQAYHPGTLGIHHGKKPLPLRDIVAILDDTYCCTIGVEIDHITDMEERLWLKDRIETEHRNRPAFDNDYKKHILHQLHKAELWEKFCHKRYPGVKRFSLEGGETLIPMLDRLVEDAADEHGVQEIVMGMSHRGRLNVLTNTAGKSYAQIFTEFEDAWDDHAEDGGSGDVKYHRGFSDTRLTKNGNKVWVSLSSNPSHLEAVGPVVIGRCRAKQRLRGDAERAKVIPVVLHGDAAVIGQGVVAETFNLSGLKGYTVGGTVHVVVNNLIGFTTGYEDARCSEYCTDFAKQIEAPVLHVNGEDPEACVHAIRIALDYRMQFKKDVVLDMWCYRRHGHNETDEAAFTQPKLYAQIKKKPSVLQAYSNQLLEQGVATPEDVEQMRSSLEEEMDASLAAVREKPVDPTPNPGHRRWVGLDNQWNFDSIMTGVPKEELAEIAKVYTTVPEGFTPHPKIKRVLDARSKTIEENTPMDWATAEQLAVGSLLIEGVIVRMSGQDSRRGTFSQRHAALTDNKTGESYVPLNHIREQGVPGTAQEVGTVNDEGQIRQAKYCIYDSPLSEFAVLGFEYGFSLSSPSILTLWEAQFGDFANGAQVIIDQFIASAESKWSRWSGLTLLLPHGYEGQGPEHSSARLERFLKLCGRNNMQVACPTTPAQYFHMLRRQMVRKFRKPLVVMTPKSLLRLPACTSTPDEITGTTRFYENLDDPHFAGTGGKGKDAPSREGVKRLILCSGKVYYDLDRRRNELGRDDLAIVRIEQLYPLHLDSLKDIMDSYPNAEVVWVQEEPWNAGAFGHMHLSFYDKLGITLPYIGRTTSASPAVGSPKKHREELEGFLTEAVGNEVDPTSGGRAKDAEAAGPPDKSAGTKKKAAKKKQAAA